MADVAAAVTPLRVLWLIKGLGPGGAEHLLLQQARAHDAATLDLRCGYLVPWKNHLVPDMEAAGVAATCLDGEHMQDLRWVRRLWLLLRDFRPDVVHVHSPLVAVFVRLVVRGMGRGRPRLVVTEHNDWSRHRRPTRWLNAATYWLDDAHVAVSDGVYDTVAPWARGDLAVLHHGIDLDAVRASADRDGVRRELGIPADHLVVGIVANYRREKDHPNLFAAADIALAADPGLTIVVVGQGPLADDIAAMHAASHDPDRIIVTGYRDDARRVMSAFDVFTLASRHEGLPVTAMEAVALGLPIVATRVGGLAEIVDDGVSGWLVPAGDPGQLAERWLTYRDHELLKSHGERAFQRSSAFDVRRALDELILLYGGMSMPHSVTRGLQTVTYWARHGGQRWW